MGRRNKCRRNRRKHARIRASERYNMCLTMQDIANIIGMIRNGDVIASIRQSCSRSVKLIDYQQMRLVLVYSHRHHEIVTFLPPDNRFTAQLEACACD